MPNARTQNSLVAAYVRKSTAEHQRYSIENQLAAIKTYAEANGLQIARTYSDSGKSGLKVGNRDALKQLLLDVQSGEAPYSSILVYDVSRWGRFQDADESAYYEYACKRSGITVCYCAEQFTNDGTPLSTIIKGLKRAMAAEYSRELGVKVYAGQKNLFMRGFHIGAVPGYGFRRMLVDASGKPKQLLKDHERKSISSDRIILVPGPKEEQRIVRWIFHAFTQRGMWETAIASALNRRHVPAGRKALWDYPSINRILMNPKYAGDNVWGRTTQRLGSLSCDVPEGGWIHSPIRLKPIVSKHTFESARRERARRQRRATKEHLVTRLKMLLLRKGKLTERLIDADPSLPSARLLARHFDNSLILAYRLAGYRPKVNYDWVELNRSLLRMHGRVVDEVRALFERRADVVVLRRVGRSVALFINNTKMLYVILTRCRTESRGTNFWCLRLDESATAGAALVLRMDKENKEIVERYFIPALDIIRSRPKRWEKRMAELKPYRINQLSELCDLLYERQNGCLNSSLRLSSAEQ